LKLKGYEVIQIVGTTSPNQAAQYLEDGSMKFTFLWDPGEAGHAMVWLAKQVLDKKEVVEGTEIPTIGKILALKELRTGESDPARARHRSIDRIEHYSCDCRSFTRSVPAHQLDQTESGNTRLD